MTRSHNRPSPSNQEISTGEENKNKEHISQDRSALITLTNHRNSKGQIRHHLPSQGHKQMTDKIGRRRSTFLPSELFRRSHQASDGDNRRLHTATVSISASNDSHERPSSRMSTSSETTTTTTTIFNFGISSHQRLSDSDKVSIHSITSVRSTITQRLRSVFSSPSLLDLTRSNSKKKLVGTKPTLQTLIPNKSNGNNGNNNNNNSNQPSSSSLSPPSPSYKQRKSRERSRRRSSSVQDLVKPSSGKKERIQRSATHTTGSVYGQSLPSPSIKSTGTNSNTPGLPTSSVPHNSHSRRHSHIHSGGSNHNSTRYVTSNRRNLIGTVQDESDQVALLPYGSRFSASMGALPITPIGTTAPLSNSPRNSRSMAPSPIRRRSTESPSPNHSRHGRSNGHRSSTIISPSPPAANLSWPYSNDSHSPLSVVPPSSGMHSLQNLPITTDTTYHSSHTSTPVLPLSQQQLQRPYTDGHRHLTSSYLPPPIQIQQWQQQQQRYQQHPHHQQQYPLLPSGQQNLSVHGKQWKNYHQHNLSEPTLRVTTAKTDPSSANFGQESLSRLQGQQQLQRPCASSIFEPNARPGLATMTAFEGNTGITSARVGAKNHMFTETDNTVIVNLPSGDSTEEEEDEEEEEYMDSTDESEDEDGEDEDEDDEDDEDDDNSEYSDKFEPPDRIWRDRIGPRRGILKVTTESSAAKNISKRQLSISLPGGTVSTLDVSRSQSSSSTLDNELVTAGNTESSGRSSPLIADKKSLVPKQFRFNESVLVGVTWTASEYNRRGDSFMVITPLLAQSIKTEINEFKTKEMTVHEKSRVYTHLLA